MTDPNQPPVNKPDSNEPTPPPAYAPPAPPAYGATPAAPAYGAAPAAPQAYAPQGYGQPAAGEKWNVLSIISLVTSIIGISLAGIICGHIGLSQIKKTGERGRGLAIGGLVVGYLGLIAGLIFVVVFFVVIMAGIDSGYSTY